MPGPVTKLVQRGAIPVDRLGERALRRDCHIVLGGRIIGLHRPDPEIRAARADQRMRCRNGLVFGQWQVRCQHRLGQAFALPDVEYREPLEKRDLPRLAILVARAVLLALGREPVGLADRGSALALADAAAQRLCLLERQPALRAIAPRHHRSPQDQHVDPGIAPPALRIARHRAATGCAVPRLHPWSRPASSSSITRPVTCAYRLFRSSPVLLLVMVLAPSSIRTGPGEGGWAARSGPAVQLKRRAAPPGPHCASAMGWVPGLQRSGRPGAAGLRRDAAGLEGSDRPPSLAAAETNNAGATRRPQRHATHRVARLCMSPTNTHSRSRPAVAAACARGPCPSRRRALRPDRVCYAAITMRGPWRFRGKPPVYAPLHPRSASRGIRRRRVIRSSPAWAETRQGSVERSGIERGRAQGAKRTTRLYPTYGFGGKSTDSFAPYNRSFGQARCIFTSDRPLPSSFAAPRNTTIRPFPSAPPLQ